MKWRLTGVVPGAGVCGRRTQHTRSYAQEKAAAVGVSYGMGFVSVFFYKKLWAMKLPDSGEPRAGMAIYSVPPPFVNRRRRFVNRRHGVSGPRCTKRGGNYYSCHVFGIGGFKVRNVQIEGLDVTDA